MQSLKKILAAVLLLVPSLAFATSTIPWVTPDITSGFITPNLVNGVAQSLVVSSTTPSIFGGGLTLPLSTSYLNFPDSDNRIDGSVNKINITNNGFNSVSFGQTATNFYNIFGSPGVTISGTSETVSGYNGSIFFGDNFTPDMQISSTFANDLVLGTADSSNDVRIERFTNIQAGAFIGSSADSNNYGFATNRNDLFTGPIHTAAGEDPNCFSVYQGVDAQMIFNIDCELRQIVLGEADGTTATIVNGKLGIGTTSPYTSLAVVGTTTASVYVATTTATSTFAGGLNLTGGCFAKNGVCITGSGGSGGSMFATSSSQALTIYPNSALALVIGRTATTTNSYLEVNGTTTATNFVATSTTATSTFAGVVIGKRVYVEETGNVNSTPFYFRNTSVSSGDNLQGLAFRQNTVGRPELVGLQADGGINNLFEFRGRSGPGGTIVVNSEQFLYSNNANISMIGAAGTGQTVPMVNMNTSNVAELGPNYAAIISGFNVSDPLQVYYGRDLQNTPGYLRFVAKHTGGDVEVARFDQNFNFLIGTTTSTRADRTKLHINAFANATTTANDFWVSSSTPAGVQDTHFIIKTTTGNVGIATTSPAAKLEVYGGGLKLDPGSASKPTCTATIRGTSWYTPGGAGVADAYEVCRKDAADAYAWVTAI